MSRKNTTHPYEALVEGVRRHERDEEGQPGLVWIDEPTGAMCLGLLKEEETLELYRFEEAGPRRFSLPHNVLISLLGAREALLDEDDEDDPLGLCELD